MAEGLLQDTRLSWAGLGARDSLRLEAGMCLHGNDISELTDPVMTRLMWTVRKERRDFIGAERLKAILKEKSSSEFRVGLVGQGKGIVRQGAQLVDQDSRPIGQVTSGTMSPVLGLSIAMGYVSLPFSKVGQTVYGVVRGKALPMTVTRMPFVPSNYYK